MLQAWKATIMTMTTDGKVPVHRKANSKLFWMQKPGPEIEICLCKLEAHPHYRVIAGRFSAEGDAAEAYTKDLFTRRPGETEGDRLRRATAAVNTPENIAINTLENDPTEGEC